jgi:hypothetical protein
MGAFATMRLAEADISRPELVLGHLEGRSVIDAAFTEDHDRID